jgi:hypothetical protein
VHHGVIHTEKSNKLQQCIKIIIIPYLYEAQHVSGDTPPIIRSLELHWQPLVFHTWKVVGRVFVGRCQAHTDNGRCVARNMLSFILISNNKILIHCCILLDFYYEHSLMYNNYCFSTATIIALTCLIVTFYVHYMPCLVLVEPRNVKIYYKSSTFSFLISLQA